MPTQHTPEPWDFDGSHIYGALDTHLPGAVAELCESSFISKAERNANAHRIAACVNACAGINPKAVPDMLVALKNAGNVLAALATGQLSGIDRDSHALDLVRKAIAKATPV